MRIACGGSNPPFGTNLVVSACLRALVLSASILSRFTLSGGGPAQARRGIRNGSSVCTQVLQKRVMLRLSCTPIPRPPGPSTETRERA